MRILLLTLLSLAPAASAVTIDWVTVGDPRNACDLQSQGCFGAVAANYRIAETEVTNSQYAEFLNAVAATDTNSLYNTSMGAGFGGITRSGSSGSFSYSPIAARRNMPVNYVSFHDSLRFSNWLQNGQPTGVQSSATTEDGAYTITGAGIANNSITRNAGATIFLTSEDEWYKAAYYDAVSASFFDFPASTNEQTICGGPTASANHANCGVVSGPTDVGSYTGSASPNGTFDQGGNVWEWNEAIISGSSRGRRGGSFFFVPDTLAASFRRDNPPTSEFSLVGFRVASVIPEPSPARNLAIMPRSSSRRRSAISCVRSTVFRGLLRSALRFGWRPTSRSAPR